jgi:lysophospholipase L1-like esterase
MPRLCFSGGSGIVWRMKKRLHLGLMVALSSVVCRAEGKPRVESGGEPTRLVAFGDSITRGYGLPQGAGWVELLSKLLAKEPGNQPITVVNAGGNGNTSAEGLKRMDVDVLAHMPGLVLIEFGGNDTVHDARAVSVADFEKNLLTMEEKVRSQGGSVVFLTFSPIVNEWHSSRTDPYYKKLGGTDKVVEGYRKKTRDVAKRLGCPLFDLDQFLRKQIQKKKQEGIMNKDGVHLTPEANKLIADAVLKFLKDNKLLQSKIPTGN